MFSFIKTSTFTSNTLITLLIKTSTFTSNISITLLNFLTSRFMRFFALPYRFSPSPHWKKLCPAHPCHPPIRIISWTRKQPPLSPWKTDIQNQPRLSFFLPVQPFFSNRGVLQSMFCHKGCLSCFYFMLSSSFLIPSLTCRPLLFAVFRPPMPDPLQVSFKNPCVLVKISLLSSVLRLSNMLSSPGRAVGRSSC